MRTFLTFVFFVAFCATTFAAQLTLRWQDNSNNETGFTIARAPGLNATTGFVVIANRVSTSAERTGAGDGVMREYIDNTLEPATGYTYRVRAYNENGDSAWSATASATTRPNSPLDPSNPGVEPPPAHEPPEPVVVNISTRGHVGGADDVMIVGFVTKQPAKLLTRAVGPSLRRFGLGDLLAQPVLEVLDKRGVRVARNDGWRDDAAIAAAAADVFAFPLDAGSRDAALLLDLPPGQYTAIVRGAGDTAGLALGEMYLVR